MYFNVANGGIYRHHQHAGGEAVCELPLDVNHGVLL